MNPTSCLDKHVSCRKHNHQYVPPLWIMCLESVAHLLVMLNSSSNFLIYCSVSKQFKTALSRRCLGLVRNKETQENRNIPKGVMDTDKDSPDNLENQENHPDGFKEEEKKVSVAGSCDNVGENEMKF